MGEELPSEVTGSESPTSVLWAITSNQLQCGCVDQVPDAQASFWLHTAHSCAYVFTVFTFLL